MNRLVSIALLALCGQCMGEPLLAVACEPPVGISIQYGASSFDQLAAMQANKPLPTKQEFGDPIRDGYERRPTFVLQNADEITITWQESERELKLKKSRKKSGVKEVDSTPAAEEARVLSNMSPLSITAVRESGFQTSLYSFYPKDGIVFISEHYKDVGSKATWSRALYSRCKFSGYLLR